MNRNQKILIKLLNCAIGKDISLDITNKHISWSYILTESKAHNIYPLLYPVIKNLSSPTISNDLKEAWKRDIFSLAVYLNKQNIQMAKVFKQFNDSNISVMALKGLILRSLYPMPDLRTMADADILIHKKDIEKAKTLLTRIGYMQIQDSTPAHITFMHKLYTPIEVHWTLADSRFTQGISSFESEIWKNAVTEKIGDATVLRLCYEDFLMHLCIHMATHMRCGGFGLRQLSDLVLLVENEGSNIDWESFNNKIKLNGIEKFTVAIFNVCNLLFNLNIPKEFKNTFIDKKYIKMLINDIFDSGVFGRKYLGRVFGNTILNADIVFNDNNSRKISNVIDIICPPINSLSNAYSYAKKYKILIPIAWIHHFFAGIFNKQYTLFDKLNFFFFSTITFKKRRKLIRNLNL